ncbi:family 43 glycosylhydrolase [Polaribacter reichenbachii]|uniref:family 43 glycosylhydrolase n=1 Tax=Polaribacter reichenbachii TaxID=996801 RepID=UPI001CFFAF60|nr:family 43 glycosylhydrolase [Polaribacter reichenbachii]
MSCNQIKKSKNQNNTAKLTNPVIKGHFADPTIVKHKGNYYVYATIDPWGGDELAVFQSSDFINWQRKKINWPTREACSTPISTNSRVWAPCVIKGKDGKFYMYVSVGSEIWAGVSSTPLGPWKNAKADNSPLIKGNMFPKYHMIDAEAFIDDDGKAYLYWGSGLNWKNGHCFIVPLNDDMISFDENEIKDITPPHFFEAPFMMKKNNKYYLMYSEGKCIDSTYMVRYSVGKTPYGPWTEGATSPVLSTSKDGTTLGPGHHTVFSENNQDYILYHRIKDNNNTLLREIAIDSLNFDVNGNLLTVEPQGGVTSFVDINSNTQN